MLLLAGGYFFGTVPDGRKVAEIIHTFGRWPKYESPMLKLEAKWQGEMQSFGSGYTCAIGDTVTEGDLINSTTMGPRSVMLLKAIKTPVIEDTACFS